MALFGRVEDWRAGLARADAQPNDSGQSLVALDQDSTVIAVVEMSQSSWLVGGVLGPVIFDIGTASLIRFEWLISRRLPVRAA